MASVPAVAARLFLLTTRSLATRHPPTRQASQSTMLQPAVAERMRSYSRLSSAITLSMRPVAKRPPGFFVFQRCSAKLRTGGTCGPAEIGPKLTLQTSPTRTDKYKYKKGRPNHDCETATSGTRPTSKGRADGP